VQSHASPFELGESKEEGALSALSRYKHGLSHPEATTPEPALNRATEKDEHYSQAKQVQAPETLLQKDEKLFKHLLQQEKQVDSAEKSSEGEIGGLIKKLG